MTITPEELSKAFAEIREKGMLLAQWSKFPLNLNTASLMRDSVMLNNARHMTQTTCVMKFAMGASVLEEFRVSEEFRGTPKTLLGFDVVEDANVPDNVLVCVLLNPDGLVGHVGARILLAEQALHMSAYQCHKVVKALQVVSLVSDNGRVLLEFKDGQSLWVTEEWYVQHAVHSGGYFVVYDNGHKSFSPEDAFVAGYNQIVARPVE